MRHSPALEREYLPLYSNLVIKMETISPAYTMKWYILCSVIISILSFYIRAGLSWLLCGLLDFYHLIATLLCLSLSKSPSTAFQTLGHPAAILQPMEAGCHMARSSHQTLLYLSSESGGKLEKGRQ